MKFTKLIKATDVPEDTRYTFDDYFDGVAGDFFECLAKAISVADKGNLELLEKVYPNLVRLYKNQTM